MVDDYGNAIFESIKITLVRTPLGPCAMLIAHTTISPGRRCAMSVSRRTTQKNVATSSRPCPAG